MPRPPGRLHGLSTALAFSASTNQNHETRKATQNQGRSASCVMKIRRLVQQCSNFSFASSPARQSPGRKFAHLPTRHPRSTSATPLARCRNGQPCIFHESIGSGLTIKWFRLACDEYGLLARLFQYLRASLCMNSEV